jgi:hypothetical protein
MTLIAAIRTIDGIAITTVQDSVGLLVLDNITPVF